MGQPKCGLCEKRDLPCLGVGQQRLKFVNKSNPRAVARVARPLSNDTTKLTARITSLFNIDPPGLTLDAVLQRSVVRIVGHFPPLDASLDCLARIYSAVHASSLKPPELSGEVLRKYTYVVGKVQKTLTDNSWKQHQRETLLMLFILSFCHMWIIDDSPDIGNISRGNINALVQLLKLATNQKWPNAQFYDDALKLAAIQVVCLTDQECFADFDSGPVTSTDKTFG